MNTKKSPTPLDIFPNGKAKKPKTEPAKVDEKKFEGEVNLELFKEALKNKKFNETVAGVARECFGYGSVVRIIMHKGHKIGLCVRTKSGYELVMQWGDLDRMSLMENSMFFTSLEDVEKHCINAYSQKPYRSVERHNVNSHW